MICDLDSPFIALAALSISPIMSVLHLYFILLFCHHHGEYLVFKVNQSEYSDPCFIFLLCYILEILNSI